MLEKEFLIVQAWVKEILTLPEKTIEADRQSMVKGSFSQLHKGGRTNKTSDPRPVVLFSSWYELRLLNYTIIERLKRIVEQANVFEPGQGGRRHTGSKCTHQHAKNAFRHA